ncbi:MCE family protein [candidate division KSB1 bacterium]|nr:MCE family protein [candidate division KSB1 bacterium]
MSTHRTIEIAVGFFVLIAILCLLLGILWGQGHPFFSSQTRLSVRFQDVQGLEAGDPVLIRGISVGQTEKITLMPDYAEVILQLEKEITFLSDMQVCILNSDLMGGKQVLVEPGTSGHTLREADIVWGTSKGDINHLLVQADGVVARMDSLLSGFLPAVKSGKLDQTLDHLENTTRDLRGLLSRNTQKFDDILDRFEKASRQFEADSTLANLGFLVQRMDTTVQLASRLARRIENQEGTMGKLVRDPTLYQELLQTTREMDSLVTDIKANPKRYINVSVF